MATSQGTFISIAESLSYQKLKSLKPLVKSDEVSFASIFNAVKPELAQVGEDLVNVHKVIISDIGSELEQMKMLENKLQDSSRKLKHLYSKNSRLREKNNKFSNGSKHFQLIGESCEEIDKRLSSISQISECILQSFITIDNKFPNSQKLLVDDMINERHYPTLFALLKTKFPDQLSKVEESHTYDNEMVNLTDESVIEPTLDDTDRKSEGIEINEDPQGNTILAFSQNESNYISEPLSQATLEIEHDKLTIDTPDENIESTDDHTITNNPKTELEDNDVSNAGENALKMNGSVNKQDASHIHNNSSQYFMSKEINKIVYSPIPIPITHSITLPSFKKPSRASTLTSFENISASDIVSDHLSNQDNSQPKNEN